jgi:N-acetylglucosaminyl-diphospho-decaprenol L-rhamnosyltransferase
MNQASGPWRPAARAGLRPDGAEAPAVSAIIVSYNAGDDLVRCLDSLGNQECDIEVIVVDNGSSDGSVDRARLQHPGVRVLSDGINDGFAGGANRGAAVARARTLLFLNPDVVLEPGCADALLVALRGGANAMVCGPLLVDSDHQSVVYGLTIDYAGDPVALSSSGAPLYVSGCALATTQEAFAALGGFDSAFFMFCEDLDLCWRALLQGLDVRAIPDARIRHRSGGSTPGGNVRSGRIEVTAFRIALRERNMLATLIRCGPAAWLGLVVPMRVTRMAAITIVAVLMGRRDLARALVEAMIWNIRRLPSLVRQRNAMVTSRNARRRVLRGRMVRDFTSVRMLLRYGPPHFVDTADQP